MLINQLTPPTMQSLPYRQLLDEKLAKDKRQPKRADIARLIPEDQYFLHFHSLKAAGEVLDLSVDWGDSLLRLFTVTAQDNRVQQKLEEQLCLRRDPLTKLFAGGAVSELAIAGSDPFVLEGTDVTLILRLKKPELFQAAADAWLAETKQQHPDLVEQEFNYRGHKIAARYTNDRVVSSFVATHGDYVIYSNSHRAIRDVIDAATGIAPRLYDALDYQYVTTLLPPSDDANSGYLFASEAFIRRMISPAAKISEKRRLECFNNLVMLNNASLMYRMENGKSPTSINDLVEGHFVDPSKVVCPHGGAYSIDAAHDTCTCSLHNRLKYLTPNCELSVLKVSQEEQAEYDRYKQRYEQFWRTVFDPIAVRITVEPQVKLETCILPFANGGLYHELRSRLADKPQTIDTRHIASSAVVSLAAVPGRAAIGNFVRDLPGVAEVVASRSDAGRSQVARRSGFAPFLRRRHGAGNRSDAVPPARSAADPTCVDRRADDRLDDARGGHDADLCDDRRGRPRQSGPAARATFETYSAQGRQRLRAGDAFRRLSLARLQAARAVCVQLPGLRDQAAAACGAGRQSIGRRDEAGNFEAGD